MAPPLVRLSDLQFRWRKSAPLILNIPSFDIARGERVFLRGPSGSGKTTLLNLLGGVTVPEAGRVEVCGADLAELGGAARDRFRASRIGFVFQMFNLVPYLSMIENVTLPCRFSRERAERTGTAGGPEAEARRLLSHMKLDPDALSGQQVAELSVGQQQRVAAARALIGQPDLIIADEPTSAIDADARAVFLDLLSAELAQSGGTLLFVSHDTGLDTLFDRTVDLSSINRA